MLPGIPIREEQCIGDSLPIINEAFRLLDSRSSVPPGTILSYGGAIPPDGYFRCDGSYVRVDLYLDLFNVLTRSGTTFPYGNNKVIEGLVNFKLPNLEETGGTDSAFALIVPDKIPIGTIIMWNGLTIPDGWVLCDGSSGTPDLRSRFIVGAGGQYQLGATGGQNSVTLTEEQIPAHRHGLHGYDIGKQSKDTGQFHLTVEDDWRKPATARTADMDLAGGGGAHENRPPYYALLFIMKKKSTDTTITGPDGNTVSTAPYINIIKF